MPRLLRIDSRSECVARARDDAAQWLAIHPRIAAEIEAKHSEAKRQNDE